MATNRRDFISFGFGSLLLAACGTRSSAQPPRDALAPTPQIPDEDAPPPVPSRSTLSCEPTADNIEGPFYKAGAPHRAVLASAKEPGERLVISGAVVGLACSAIANATLDVWQADTRGGYDNDGWGLRGQLVTDANGRFQISSIVPGRYLNGRRYRPTHVHVKLRAEGYRELTTQLYFAGDPYNKGDDFIVDSLIMAHKKVGDTRRAGFQFVLAPA